MEFQALTATARVQFLVGEMTRSSKDAPHFKGGKPKATDGLQGPSGSVLCGPLPLGLLSSSRLPLLRLFRATVPCLCQARSCFGALRSLFALPEFSAPRSCMSYSLTSFRSLPERHFSAKPSLTPSKTTNCRGSFPPLAN